ncbi:unnamed protein product, partial [Mesorhabditis spiculigera]
MTSYVIIYLGLHKTTNLCTLALFEALKISSMLCSNWHLFILTLNHWCGTMWPLRHKIWVTNGRMRYVLVGLWVLPHAYVFAWFWALPDGGFRDPTCSMKFYFSFPFRATTFPLFFLPILATVAMYFKIVRCLSEAQLKMVKSSPSCADPLTRRSSAEGNVKRKMRLLVTSLIIVSSYCFSWGPHMIFFVMVCYQDCPIVAYRDIRLRTAVAISVIVNTLVIIKMAANLFIYTLRMEKFRICIASDCKSIKRIFLKICRSSIPHSPLCPRRLTPTRQQYIRPCWMNLWGQFRKPDNNGFSLRDWQPGMCTHLIIEAEWLQDEVAGRPTSHANAASVSSEYCSKIKDMATKMGGSKIQSWATENCEFLRVVAGVDDCTEFIDMVNLCTSNSTVLHEEDSWIGANFVEKVVSLKKIDPDLMVLLSISGRTFGAVIFEELKINTRRIEFTYACLSFLKMANLDGVALDWSDSAGDMKNYASYLQEFQTVLNEANAMKIGSPYQVVAILPGDKQSLFDNYDLRQISSVDFVVLMPFNITSMWTDPLQIWNQVKNVKLR